MSEIKDLLPKLNRMRENAGMKPLKSWKASKDKLQEKIDELTEQGYTDALPGADVNASAKIDDPEVAKARPEKAEPLKEEAKVTKVKPGLGRGVENDAFGRNCRDSLRSRREKEKAAEKAERKANKKKGKVELSEEDKRFLKDEAKFRGKVDPDKDPAKAKRQAEKVKAKQDKRKAEGKTTKKVADNQVTAADLAREVGMSPKIARAKLRRHKNKIQELYPKWGGIGDWVFPKTIADEIKKILK